MFRILVLCQAPLYVLVQQVILASCKPVSPVSQVCLGDMSDLVDHGSVYPILLSEAQRASENDPHRASVSCIHWLKETKEFYGHASAQTRIQVNLAIMECINPDQSIHYSR